jgi:uncharacterized protein YbjT (DUF2867 family)
MFVIAGATGKTGTAVVRTLLAAGREVRGLARGGERAQRAPQAGLTYRDVPTLADSNALAAALEGAEGAYILLPTDLRTESFLDDARRTVEAIATAVEISGVPHVVLLSSIGAQHAQGTGPIVALHHAEQRLRATGAGITVLRAALFLENWAAVAGVARTGTLPTFVPPGLAYPTVAAADIGRVAAQALLTGPAAAGHQVIELAGPRELSADDVAAILARLLDREVKAQQVPPAAVAPTLQGLGISADVSALYAELYAGLARGALAWEGHGTRAMRGEVPAEEVLRGLVEMAAVAA